MSTRFVAPPPPPALPTPNKSTLQSTLVQHDQLPPPPPLHPALARRRTPIPHIAESMGALNSSPPSQSVSLAPPLPQRPPQIHQQNVPTLDPQSSSTSALLQPVLSDTQSSGLDSTYTRSNSNVSLASSETPSTPLLLVTPVEAASADDISHRSSLRADTLPPYAFQPALPTQVYPKPPEHPNGAHAPPPGLDTSVSGLQYHDVVTETPTQRIPSPPTHPSRQPSLSPSFINLPVPSHPTLRHRAQSNGSDRGLDTPATRPATLEHSRRGSGTSILTLKDENLTDEDLRNLYDAEEVERYLRLFASRVNEVTMHPDHPDASVPVQIHTDEEDWISLSSPPPTQPTELSLPQNLQSPSTPFEYIAALIYPYVSQTSPPPAKRRFKLSRAANSAQRLYLATYPAYVPALIHLAQLSMWRNPKKSGIWCAAFWTAWAAGLLTPLILGRILYVMCTGGTVTREEIRRRREAAREAEALGRAIKGGVPGIGMSGDLNIWDLAKLVRGAGRKKQKKAKAAMGEVMKGEEGEVVISAEDDTEDPDDWRLQLVDVADELADLHERVKNIFLHRRPASTRFYTIALSVLFVGSLFVQNISRLITFNLGFFFWFIPPVVKHLPRLPPAFSDAPTDAEVAIDLITKRVARGERVVPERIPWRKRDKEKDRTDTKSNASMSNLNLTDIPTIRSPSTTSLLPGSDESEDETAFVMPSQAKEVPVPPEDRFRKRAVRAWNWMGKTKQLMDQVRGVEGQATVYASPEQSFPAQHHSRPGMLTISSTFLTFTPLFASSTPAASSPTSNVIKVDTERLRGVKKVSPGGLVIRYVKRSEVVEERFLLVVGRDQAFATLVGWGGGRWKHV
ncbi:hypothetical protein FRC06_004284 [Ceratobasidium sp. 370]|nr:hypothetical protein FRC06_004284 [Ceratobasidium sp. 370]